MSPTSYDELLTTEHPEPSDAVLVEREEVAVMYRVTDDNPEAMGRAWAELEAAVGLRGRKFFGTFQPSTGEYRVCVQLRDGDDPDALGLKVGLLPEWQISPPASPGRAARRLPADRSIVRGAHKTGRS